MTTHSRNGSTPKRVLVIGSGPIVIGQAAEFDYAGTQACKSLREEGVEVILVNSNPATIMTDEDVADRVYIEPLTVAVIERIIERERPDGLLATLGGQTGLNLAVELSDAGVLAKYNVPVLGTGIESIKMAEDRDLFKSLLLKIGEPVPVSEAVSTVGDALRVAVQIGYPVVVRPAYTLGGTGGGVCDDEAQLRETSAAGISASLVHQVLIEKSLVGWKEIEYEVMRDGAGNCITICNMENLDPMGVHTGDSIVVAPSQTLTDKDYQRLRTSALNIIRALDIKGGCNVQFAYRPSDIVGKTIGLPSQAGVQPSSSLEEGTGDPMYYVIEVNPRVSRSSALASKATGYPIARVAAKIALGKTLDEIPNAVTKRTTAAFEPALDYCVVKIPRWPFDKFPTGDHRLGTQMKATGEVMAIDRSFEAALQKAIRSLENNRGSLLWEDRAWAASPLFKGISDGSGHDPVEAHEFLRADDDRLWKLTAVIRRGMSAEDVSRITGIDPWFARSLALIVAMERRLLSEDLSPALMRQAKRNGFSDAQIATLCDSLPDRVREQRKEWGIKPVYKMVDTCAGEFEAITPYFYSTYEQENEALSIGGGASRQPRALVIGSGPIRIGQGIEFDYSSVHAAWALQAAGYKAIMANSNPETVSTDFDTSDRLYFEPLDEEGIRDILENEAVSAVDSLPSGEGGVGALDYPGSVVQFGGQTAINLSQALGRANLPILGSPANVIDSASDRGRLEDIAAREGVPQPPGGVARTLDQALQVATNIGYPLIVRPSYVLGGRGMEIVQSEGELAHYFDEAMRAAPNQTVLLDRYLEGVEVEVDAVCDGEDVLIPGIMQHIERAGVHSGDSMAVYPAPSLTKREVDTIVDYTARIGRALGIKGLMNLQFVVYGSGAYRSGRRQGLPSSAMQSPQHPPLPDTRMGGKGGSQQGTQVYLLEVNPRGSRTAPFISKVTRVPIVRIGVNVMLGKSIREQGYTPGLAPRRNLVAVKAPVFSMSKLKGVDTYLGPEMKSTGEVMGIDRTYEGAFAKALIASGLHVPERSSVLLSISERDKPDAAGLVRGLAATGHRLYATSGTAAMIKGMGIEVTLVEKRLSGAKGETVVDVIENGTVRAVVNTVTGDRRTMQDGFHIRRAAAERRIPCFTSLDTARAAVESLEAGDSAYSVMTMKEYLEG